MLVRVSATGRFGSQSGKRGGLCRFSTFSKRLQACVNSFKNQCPDGKVEKNKKRFEKKESLMYSHVVRFSCFQACRLWLRSAQNLSVAFLKTPFPMPGWMFQFGAPGRMLLAPNHALFIPYPGLAGVTGKGSARPDSTKVQTKVWQTQGETPCLKQNVSVSRSSNSWS